MEGGKVVTEQQAVPAQGLPGGAENTVGDHVKGLARSVGGGRVGKERAHSPGVTVT